MTFTALSIIQPWPWLILRPDLTGPEIRAAARERAELKDCENRAWEHPTRGWVLVHASSTRLAVWDYRTAALFAAKRGIDVPLRDNLPYGAIVGAMRIDDCTWAYRSRWFTGPRAFVIGAAVPFAEPILCKGAPKFFSVPSPGSGVAGAELRRELVAAIDAAGMASAFRVGAEVEPRAPRELIDRADFQLQ